MIKMMEYMAFKNRLWHSNLPEHRVTADQAAIYVTPNDEHAFAHGARSTHGRSAMRRVWEHADAIALKPRSLGAILSPIS